MNTQSTPPNITYNHLDFMIRLIDVAERFSRISATKQKITMELIRIGWIEGFGDDVDFLRLTERGHEIMNETLANLNRYALVKPA